MVPTRAGTRSLIHAPQTAAALNWNSARGGVITGPGHCMTSRCNVAAANPTILQDTLEGKWLAAPVA